MRAKQFINYCLTEYEDLSQEKDNIIKTISGLDAADEKQAAILDRIWKVLNTESYNTNIINSFVAPTEDEYMNDVALQKHRKNVAEIISRVDSDYNAMNAFLKKLEGGGVININELAKPTNSFNAIFEGDAVAIKAFDALKGYGVQAKAKGPGEYALAMLSNKIRLAEGAGDTEIEGIGDVEVKSAASDSAKGGRLGDGGPQQEQQMGILLKYEDRLPNMIAGIKAKAGGTIGIGPFVVGPPIERKIGVSAFSQLAINATKWHSASWAREKGLYAEVFDNVEDMDSSINLLAKKLANSNPESMKSMKKIMWENTDLWDSLLLERAEISGERVLSEFTRKTLLELKNSS